MSGDHQYQNQLEKRNFALYDKGDSKTKFSKTFLRNNKKWTYRKMIFFQNELGKEEILNLLWYKGGEN